jgi:hypothetical protein
MDNNYTSDLGCCPGDNTSRQVVAPVFGPGCPVAFADMFCKCQICSCTFIVPSNAKAGMCRHCRTYCHGMDSSADDVHAHDSDS